MLPWQGRDGHHVQTLFRAMAMGDGVEQILAAALYLIPISLAHGLLTLVACFWTLRSGQ
jgi:hypothetical protein